MQQDRFQARGGWCATVLTLVAAIVMLAGFNGTARADGGEWLGRVFPTSAYDVVDVTGYARDNSYRRSGQARRGGARRGQSAYAERGTRRRGGGSPFGPSLSGGGGVRWVASAGCLNPTLRSVVASMARFGGVTVSSTCRSHAHNRRVGGAPRSHHIGGNAVDFRVHGNVGAAYAALRSMAGVGGLKHYGGGLFHVDTGPRRGF